MIFNIQSISCWVFVCSMVEHSFPEFACLYVRHNTVIYQDACHQPISKFTMGLVAYFFLSNITTICFCWSCCKLFHCIHVQTSMAYIPCGKGTGSIDTILQFQAGTSWPCMRARTSEISFQSCLKLAASENYGGLCVHIALDCFHSASSYKYE